MQQIRRRCEDAGGLLQVTLGELREAEGVKRLGRHVMVQIRRSLDGAGLGYFPHDVLNSDSGLRQTTEIRVYLPNTPVGRVIHAVVKPSAAGDDLLMRVTEE